MVAIEKLISTGGDKGGCIEDDTSIVAMPMVNGNETKVNAHGFDQKGDQISLEGDNRENSHTQGWEQLMGKDLLLKV